MQVGVIVDGGVTSTSTLLLLLPLLILQPVLRLSDALTLFHPSRS